MTADASHQAVVEAALVLPERMGLTPADLAAVPRPCKPVPTFAEVPRCDTTVRAISLVIQWGLSGSGTGSQWARPP